MMFKVLISVTCVALLAAVSWHFYSEYLGHLETQRSAKIQERLDAAAADRLKRQIEIERAKADAVRLTFQTCEAMADATVPYEMDATAKTREHNADLIVCSELDRLSAYHRTRLKLLGIL